MFVSALVLGLSIHLPVMLSDIPNHDDRAKSADQNTITRPLVFNCCLWIFFILPYLGRINHQIDMAGTMAAVLRKC